MRAALLCGEFETMEASMPRYMLLLYRQDREASASEPPLWMEFTESLQDAGLLVGSERLHPVDAATTVRVRADETEILDGPFAATKEYLVGYYLLECADLDQALKQAARVPLARYGSVEVRPVVEAGTPLTADEEAAAAS
jgi:hypothetical protein